MNTIIGAPATLEREVIARGLRIAKPGEFASVADAQWPGVRVQKRGAAEAGPTGAPWVDSNGWSIRLALARNPSKPMFVEYQAPPELVLSDAAYELAVTEPSTFGARWVIALDDALASGLAASESGALSRWRKIANAAAVAVPATGVPRASLAVLSDFAGENEFLATEYLNLAARRLMLDRIIILSGAPVTLPPAVATAVLIKDQPPEQALVATLKTFVRNGGMLIASHDLEWGERDMPCAVPGYTQRAFGKGSIVFPKRDWSDPWVVAAEVRMLAGRRNDVLRVYNEGNLGASFHGDTVQLVNYSARSGNPVTIGVPAVYRSARVVTLEAPTPKPLAIAAHPGRFSEIALPAFGVYAAIQLGR